MESAMAAAVLNMNPAQLTELFRASLAEHTAPAASCVCNKHCQAYSMICKSPELWFGDTIIDDRDRALLTGNRSPLFEYSQRSYLKRLNHLKKGKEHNFMLTDWTVENDVTCKKLAESMGGTLHGYNFERTPKVHWASTCIIVNVEGPAGAPYDWGLMGTRLPKVRIFKGPVESCSLHPWDAMILRDCHPNTDRLIGTKEVQSRTWDMLLMKMCEDYDQPWVVVSVQDAGPEVPDKHDCDDTSACGCIFLDDH